METDGQCELLCDLSAQRFGSTQGVDRPGVTRRACWQHVPFPLETLYNNRTEGRSCDLLRLEIHFQALT